MHNTQPKLLIWKISASVFNTQIITVCESGVQYRLKETVNVSLLKIM